MECGLPPQAGKGTMGVASPANVECGLPRKRGLTGSATASINIQANDEVPPLPQAEGRLCALAPSPASGGRLGWGPVCCVFS
jgi:hypothetical protein